MPIVDKDTLKTYFNHQDTPDEPEFIDLIDSMLNLSESGTQTMLGTLVAPALLAETYNVDAITFQDFNSINLTSSNQFGSTASLHSHGFTGSIEQSGSCNSYFLDNVSIGTKTSYQSCLGGLTILKTKSIGANDNPAEQARSSSLLITGSDGQMAFDHNEIHQYKNDLYITSQGDSNGDGNIYFRVGDEDNHHFSSSKILTLKSNKRVGIGTQSPIRTVSIEGNDQQLPLLQIKNTGSSYLDDVFMSFNRDNSDTVGYSMGIDSSKNNFTITSNGSNVASNYLFTITGSNYNVGIGTTRPEQKLTVTGDISASGDVYVGGIAESSANFRTVMVDTASGQLHFTGSYGGGGGSAGVTSIIAGPNITIQGGSPGTGAVTISASAGGGGFWQDHTHGIELVTEADNVGIGIEPSSIHKLLVYGNGVFTGDVIAYYTSDKRLKDNIKPIEDPIGKIKQIGGYSFDWNNKQNTYEGTVFGVIAQEIEEVLPSLVQTREDGYKGVKYDKIVSLLIEAVKDQQKQIDELKKLI